jgi:hypothetical protein
MYGEKINFFIDKTIKVMTASRSTNIYDVSGNYEHYQRLLVVKGLK